MAGEVGLPLEVEKMEGLAITLLGIELDMVQQTSWLPDNKLVDLRIQFDLLLQKKKVYLQEL